jgi:predicted secreted protein
MKIPVLKSPVMQRTLSMLLFGLISSLCLTSPALAQNQLSLGELQSGQLALNLSLTEQQRVEQDTLNVSLQYIAQGRDRTELQNEVNKIMSEALELVRAVSSLEYSTTHYHVQIVQTDRPTRTDINNPVFRAQQGLNITSKDSAALLELAGELQARGLTLDGLYYTLSDAAHEQVAAELTKAALQKLQNRAQGAAEALGKQSAELVEVSMDGTPNFMDVRQKFAMETFSSPAMDYAPPVAEPGETVISITVSARAVLSP